MTKTKQKYAKTCKQKVVTFYKCDAELLKIANSLNFQKFVKICLKLTTKLPFDIRDVDDLERLLNRYLDDEKKL